MSFFLSSASLARAARRSKTESVRDELPVSADSTSLMFPLSLDEGLVVEVDCLDLEDAPTLFLSDLFLC